MDSSGTPIELDRPRRVIFDFNALAKFEEVTGRSLLAEGGIDSTSAVHIRALLWVGLLHDDPDITIEQAGAMVHIGNMGMISTKLAEAFATDTDPKNLPAARSRKAG